MKRSYFQPIPFVRFFSLFLSGIVVAFLLNLNPALCAVLFTGLLVFQVFYWYQSSFQINRVKDALLSAAIVSAGALYLSIYNAQYTIQSQKKDYFLAEVCQQPAEKANTFQTILKVRNRENYLQESIIAYFEKRGFDSTITTGDQLIILAKLQPIKNAGNPFEFDYQTMMSRRRIFYSAYLAYGTYLKTGRQTVNLHNLAEKVRDGLVQKLTKVLPDKEERSVVCALTLGYRTELDQDTLDYFASTGAMHVLSVSGLHVALLYMILSFAFGFLNRGKRGRIVFTSSMIAFLWIYAFISGFSPPVQRATVMFSFVILGSSIGRTVNIYNSLAASAVVLILLNPLVVFDVGFQLSYLAIVGIVLIQPLLNDILELKNKSLAWIWALFTVSIAAQIITFPLGVYYFNQFPNFFWLSNFVVVPITTAIMWLALAFFMLLPIPLLAQFVGFLIQKLTWAMLEALKILDHHPLAVTKGLVFSEVQVFLLYGVILATLIFVLSKRKSWLYATLALLIGFQIADLIEKSRLLNQRFVMVYNSKSTIVHLINGRTNYLLFSEEGLTENDKKMIGKVSDHLRLNKPIWRNRNQFRPVELPDLVMLPQSVQFLNCRILFKNKPMVRMPEEIVFNVSGNNRPTIVSTGYRASGRNPENTFFTKTDGAYRLMLSKNGGKKN